MLCRRKLSKSSQVVPSVSTQCSLSGDVSASSLCHALFGAEVFGSILSCILSFQVVQGAFSRGVFALV